MSVRPRDLGLERELTLLAARAGGFSGDGGIGRFADERALPGGVREGLDPVREASEELADARNYLVWGLERIHARVAVGDPEVLDEHVALLGALQAVVTAWRALHRR